MKKVTFAFTLKYGDYEFVIPKEDVKFENGYEYGIVKTLFISDDNQYWLIGVVDKNFEQVLPLTSAEFIPKLYIAPHGNFIVLDYNSDKDEYQTIHINTEGFKYNLEAYDFLPIDKEIIKLYYQEYMVLYDVESTQFLTPFYNYIGAFVYSEKYQEKVARALLTIKDDNDNIINEISTLINVRGEVLENYYDLAHSEEIDSKDIADTINLARKKR